MKKSLIFTLAALVSSSAMAGTGWLESYVYMNDGTADTWYNLNGSTQALDFDGADLGSFELTDNLWLNGQINAWADGGDSYDYMSLFWRVGTSGSFTEQKQTTISNEGTNNFRGVPAGIDLIDNVGSTGTYTLQVYLERSHSYATGSYTTQLIETGDTGGTTPTGDFFESSFTVVPEPGALLLAALGLGSLAILRRRSSK